MRREYTSSMSDWNTPLDPHRCKAAVTDFTGFHFHQCSRKPKANGWCWQHDPEADQARRREADRIRSERLARAMARREHEDDTLEKLRRQLAEVTAHRDKLLAVCKDLMLYDEGVPSWSSIYDDCEAAIGPPETEGGE